MRSWIIAAALALVAAPALAQTTPAPAPAPDGAVTVAADDNGQTISPAVGAQVAVQLQSTPSVGSNWFVTGKPDFVSDPQTLTGPTVNSARPVLGAPRWQVFVFTIDAAGSGDITLEKRGRDGAVLETFTLTIQAQ